jgi:hypothetical protein
MKKKSKAGAEEIREKLPQIAAATGAPAPGEGRSLPSIPIDQPLRNFAFPWRNACVPHRYFVAVKAS